MTYLFLLPAAVAALPVVLPWLVAASSGWRSTWLGTWLPGAPFLLLGALWARQVLPAAEAEIVEAVERGALDADVAERWWGWTVAVVWALVVLLPFGTRATHRACEGLRFKLTAAAAARGADGAWRELGASWRQEHRAGQAFEVSDPRLDPGLFGGPFASRGEAAIGKLVLDSQQRLFYVLDRPRGIGPDVKGWLDGLRPRSGPAAAGEREEGANAWVFERGLVRTPPGVAPPSATAWGIPMQRLVAVRRGWHWYVAGEPAELSR